MEYIIKLAKLADGMEYGKLVSWNVEIGDLVNVGDVLADIEIDKSSVELVSDVKGYVQKFLVDDDEDNIKIGSDLIILNKEDTSSQSKEIKTEGQLLHDNTDELLSNKKNDDAALSDEECASVQNSKSIEKKKETVSANISDSKDMSLISSLMLGQSEELRDKINSLGESKILASNLFGKKKEVLRRSFQVSRGLNDKTSEKGKVDHASTKSNLSLDGNLNGEDEFGLNSNELKIQSNVLSYSKRTIPHFYIGDEFIMDEVILGRKDFNDKNEPQKVSINDILIKAAGLALKDIPSINVSYSKGRLIALKTCHVSFAVARNKLLDTPTIKNVDQLSISEISQQTKKMIQESKDNSLSKKTFEGGSLTISNLGMYGVQDVVSIIKPPQSFILGVGAIKEKPIVKDHKLVVGSIMKIFLSGDHRCISGTEGASFLKAMKQYIESPQNLFNE